MTEQEQFTKKLVLQYVYNNKYSSVAMISAKLKIKETFVIQYLEQLIKEQLIKKCSGTPARYCTTESKEDTEKKEMELKQQQEKQKKKEEEKKARKAAKAKAPIVDLSDTVFETLASNRPGYGWKLTAVARATGLPNKVVFAILKQLKEKGLIKQYYDEDESVTRWSVIENEQVVATRRSINESKVFSYTDGLYGFTAEQVAKKLFLPTSIVNAILYKYRDEYFYRYCVEGCEEYVWDNAFDDDDD